MADNTSARLQSGVVDLASRQCLSAQVDELLLKVGVSSAIRKKVKEAAAERQSVTGQVIAVLTKASSRTVFVSASTGEFGRFEFPPNSTTFEAELLRAQSEGLIVSVVFSVNKQDQSLIEDIWTYAGTASGSKPRY